MSHTEVRECVQCVAVDTEWVVVGDYTNVDVFTILVGVVAL